MGAKTLLSLDEFMALPDDGNKYELNQGELVTMPPASAVHALIVQRINFILSQFVYTQRIGQVLSEAGYVLSREPQKTYRQPDLSFLARERTRSATDAASFEGAPEIAIEVVSPSDRAQELALKVEQYLASGSQEVWVVYPGTRSVMIYKPRSGASVLSDSDSITTDLFPGWSARVADFFDLDY